MKKQLSIIAFEFPPYRGGIANYSHSLAKLLSFNGYEVTVFTLNAYSQPDGYLLNNPRWKYQPAQKLIFFRKVVSAVYRLYQLLHYVKFLMIFLKSHRDREIILTSLFFDFSRLTIKFFNLLGIKYRVVLHGLDIHELPVTHPGFLEKATLKMNRIIFNSEFTRSLFISGYAQPEGALVIPPLLDTFSIDQINLLTFQQLEKEVGVQLAPNLMVSVCRLVYRKGIDLAIAAAVDFLHRNPSWTYLIAGEGKEMEKLKQMIPADMKDKIVFAGSVSEKIKFSLLHHSKIFIMPNRELPDDVEGFGISFIEASYQRNWVIGGNSGGVPEAVDTTSNGYLVNMDENAVAGIIKRLDFIAANLDNNEPLERGRQFVIDNFTLQRKLDF